jgi:hypothetical protein
MCAATTREPGVRATAAGFRKAQSGRNCCSCDHEQTTLDAGSVKASINLRSGAE